MTAHILLRWTARIGLGEQLATTKTLRRRFFSLAGRLTRKARRHPASAPRLALAEPVQQRSGETTRPATPILTAPTAASACPPDYPIVCQISAPGRFPRVSCCNLADNLGRRRGCGPSTSPWRGCHTLRPAGLERIKATPSLSGYSHPLLPQGGEILSVDLGLFAKRPEEVTAMLKQSGKPLYRISKNKDGSPKHPARGTYIVQPWP